VSIAANNYTIVLKPGQTGFFESDGTNWNVNKCPPQITQNTLISLSLTIQTPIQNITGLAITLNPGTYTISYSCFADIVLSSAQASDYYFTSYLYNGITQLTDFISYNIVFSGNITGGSHFGGGTTVIQTLSITATTTFQVQIALNLTTNVTSFSAQYSSISATLLL